MLVGDAAMKTDEIGKPLAQRVTIPPGSGACNCEARPSGLLRPIIDLPVTL
jgi:hypothetical protein